MTAKKAVPIPSPVPLTPVRATSASGRKLAQQLRDIAFRVEAWPETTARYALDVGCIKKLEGLLALAEGFREGSVSIDVLELGKMVSKYLARRR